MKKKTEGWRPIARQEDTKNARCCMKTINQWSVTPSSLACDRYYSELICIFICLTWKYIYLSLYLALKFYKEAVIHLPFVVTFNNLWRMKMLHDLNYGTISRWKITKWLKRFWLRRESMYEAGPQTVTQVRRLQTIDSYFLNISKYANLICIYIS